MLSREAIVRLACIMALPTDDELMHSGAADAGEYLLALRDAGSWHLDTFITSRKVGWQREPRQKVHRCVGHLMAYLVRTIEANSGRVQNINDLSLTEEEVEDFDQKRRKGGTLAQLTNSAALLDGICAAASIIRARLLEALQNVEIFSDMSTSQLETLRDAMGTHAGA